MLCNQRHAPNRRGSPAQQRAWRDRGVGFQPAEDGSSARTIDLYLVHQREAGLLGLVEWLLVNCCVAAVVGRGLGMVDGGEQRTSSIR